MYCCPLWKPSSKSLEDSLKHSDHLKECHQISLKLFDLINASPKFTDLFKECQVSTGEANQFKARKPVEICDRPMHRWESTLKGYALS